MAKLTSNYELLAETLPINRQAVTVTKNRNEHYVQTPVDGGVAHHWENCPRLIPIDNIRHARGRELARNIMGKTFGRMRVVGIFQERIQPAKGPDIPAVWVVRCTCGCYEGRSHKAINNSENTNDMCLNCRRLEYAKRRYRELGPA